MTEYLFSLSKMLPTVIWNSWHYFSKVYQYHKAWHSQIILEQTTYSENTVRYSEFTDARGT